MKVEAYKCDYCNSILESEYIQGVKNEADLFETKNSYPTVESKKTDFHFCLECYRMKVDIEIKNRMGWKEGEKYSEDREKMKWQLHADLFFIFKKETIRRGLASLKKR